jgi:hypothetical protein
MNRCGIASAWFQASSGMVNTSAARPASAMSMADRRRRRSRITPNTSGKMK